MNVSEIEEAPASGPTRFGLHSVEGFGKTTLAAFFPAPVFLAKENGFPRDLPFRPKRFPRIERWEDALAAVDSLTVDPHDRETLVIDTVDWLEPLIHRFVCERDSGRKTELNKGGHKLISIEDYGYGKGYIAAEEEFRVFIERLDLLQAKRGMHVVMLMHSHLVKFENPGGVNFDRYEPKLHKRIARVCCEWPENLFFGYFEVEAGKIGDEKKAKGVSTGRRMLATQHDAIYDAKNRMNLPATIELKQPEDMIPYLLGEHLAGAATPTTKTVSAPPPKSEAKAPKPEKTTKAKAETKQEPQPAAPFEEQEKSPPAEGAKVTEQMRALLDIKERGLAKFGEKYVAKIDSWVSKAKGDEKKIESVIAHINAELAA